VVDSGQGAAASDRAAEQGPDAARDHAAATLPPAAGVPERKLPAASRPARTAAKAGSAARKGKPTSAKGSGATRAGAKGGAGTRRTGAKRAAGAKDAGGVKGAGAKRAGAQADRRTGRAAKPEPVAARGHTETEARRSETAPAKPASAGPVGTAVQAAAELAEIGLSISARALRNALSRLPRP